MKQLTHLYIITALLIIFCSCRKEEFRQVPHGEPVPYKDTVTQDLKTLLAASSYKLFNTAWQKSHLNELIAAQPSSVHFTILAPDDAAMTAAGLDVAGINMQTAEQLDTLLQYLVLTETLDPVALKMQKGNLKKYTLLFHESLMERVNSLGSNVTTDVPYNYRHYIGQDEDGSLMIDGLNCGNGVPVFATNGILWPVNKLLNRPVKSMLDVLQDDPRFSMFMALKRATDSIWLEVSMGFYERNIFRKLSPDNGVILPDAFFAPTDEAFHNAGFNTVDDLLALNSRSMPYFDWDVAEVKNRFVTDSILGYHTWGRMFGPYGINGYGAESLAVFYSNDLDNDHLSSFTLSVADYNIPAYIMPFDFSKTGSGQVSLSIKNATAPPAVIIEADINTFQGPLHVVDHLLIPEGLRL